MNVTVDHESEQKTRKWSSALGILKIFVSLIFLPEFISSKHFVSLKQPQVENAKQCMAPEPLFSLKQDLSDNLQRNLSSVERFPQHYRSLCCKARHVSLDTEILKINMEKSSRGTLDPKVPLQSHNCQFLIDVESQNIQAAGFCH